MTPTEAAALLTCCAGFDNRKPDPDTAKAWARALDDLRFEDCRDAVIEHYSSKRDWIMPADIRTLVARLRNKRIADEVIEMPPGFDPDNTGAYVALLASERRKQADGHEPTHYELEVADRPVGALGVAGQDVPERHRVDRQQLRRTIAANKAAMTVLEPEPLLRPEDHSREPEPTEEVA